MSLVGCVLPSLCQLLQTWGVWEGLLFTPRLSPGGEHNWGGCVSGPGSVSVQVMVDAQGFIAELMRRT